MNTRKNPRRRMLAIALMAILTVLALSACSVVLSNRVTMDEVVGEWTAVGEAKGSDALDASLTLRADGVAIGRELPPQALDFSSGAGSVIFVGTWKIVRGTRPWDFAHVVLEGSATATGKTTDESFDLLIDSGPPRLLRVWLDKSDFSRELVLARTSPD